MQNLLVYRKSTHGLHKEQLQHKVDKNILMDQSLLIYIVPTIGGPAVTHSYDTS